MSTPQKISIITASFRSEYTIKDTLESVNIQTYPYIDHIIIDGASNDGTLDIVKAHGKRVVHITTEPDKGIFDAYNKGLGVADGEIIGILNSDDFYATPHAIAHVMQAFEDPTVDAVYADLFYVDKDDTKKIIRYWKSRAYKKDDFLRGFTPAHPTLFLRKRVYAENGGFKTEFRYSGDYEFMLRIFKNNKIKSVYLPEIIVRMRTGGATGGGMKSMKKQNMEILKALNINDVKINKAYYFASKLVNRVGQRLRGVLAK